jgi:hypothetical protein
MSNADFIPDEYDGDVRERGSRAFLIGLCAAVVLVLLGTGITAAGLGARNKARNDIDVERSLLDAQQRDLVTAQGENDTTVQGANNYLAAATQLVPTASEMGRLAVDLVANSQAKRDNGLASLPGYNALGQTTNQLIAEYNAVVDQLNQQNTTLRAVLAGQAP